MRRGQDDGVTQAQTAVMGPQLVQCLGYRVLLAAGPAAPPNLLQNGSHARDLGDSSRDAIVAGNWGDKTETLH